LVCTFSVHIIWRYICSTYIIVPSSVARLLYIHGL